MASTPDLINLLCLDAQKSLSPFGGKHRTILITKDYSNTGDFVFNSLLNNFVRREPTTSILLITLSHDWSNYSASAAKCGYNMRRTQNGGNVSVLNIMEKYLEVVKEEREENFCDFILENVNKFISDNTEEGQLKPIAIMLDDLSLLRTLGAKPNQIYSLFYMINGTLRDRSENLQDNKLSYFIVQTMAAVSSQKRNQQSDVDFDSEFAHTTSNLENLCDLFIILRPLETGYSTRVDGTIKIIDNRLPLSDKSSINTKASLFPSDNLGEVGTKKAYFFKLGDRRARLTSSALIF